MKRRDFIKTTGMAGLTATSGLGILSSAFSGCSPTQINKRDIVLDLLNDSQKRNYIPGAFFMHFGKENYFGQAAVNKHLDYFKATDLDIVKIQYEKRFPLIPEIQNPSDWAKVPLLKKDFYADQLKVIEEIVKRSKKDALVIATVYSPLSFAGHLTGYKHHINHLNEDPELVKKGLEVITESTILFVKECAKLGVDGFFQATQGGEYKRFTDDTIFKTFIKPFDLSIANEIHAKGICNFLHIHAGEGKYKDYSEFTDFPSHIINCGLDLENENVTTQDLYKIFKKPILGGLRRDGIVVNGSREEITQKVNEVITDAPERFLLGANCTVPSHTEWTNIRLAMDIAHNFYNK